MPKEDRARPRTMQEEYVKIGGLQNVARLPSDHSPQLSAPDESV
jgi:hypothetical protein